MTDIHELAEKVFLANIANPYWAQRASHAQELAEWSYSAAQTFIEHREKFIAAYIDTLQNKVT